MPRLSPFILAVALCAACVSAAPTGPLQPLALGWEQHATLEFQAAPRADGSVVVWGYLQTGSPYTFHRIRVLVDALDASNQIVAQQVAWVPGTLGWPSRLYFEVPMPPAPSHRVRVDEAPSDSRPRPFMASTPLRARFHTTWMS